MGSLADGRPWSIFELALVMQCVRKLCMDRDLAMLVQQYGRRVTKSLEMAEQR